jgi:hypothetical protein
MCKMYSTFWLVFTTLYTNDSKTQTLPLLQPLIATLTLTELIKKSKKKRD